MFERSDEKKMCIRDRYGGEQTGILHGKRYDKGNEGLYGEDGL